MMARQKSKSMKQRILVFALALFSLYTKAQQPSSGTYTVRLDQPKQTIWGLGVEIQNDAIGSGNVGLPNEVIAIPNNLVPKERKRLYKDMLKGFRYCRLAMGLYFRGLDAERKHMRERYPNQLKDLKELIKASGMEGISLEYWSVAPYWKSNNDFIGGTLKSFEPSFLNEFGDALAEDAKYLQNNGINISMWALQNEAGQHIKPKGWVPPATPPVVDQKDKMAKQSFSTTEYYDAELYTKAFKAVTPKIKAVAPNAVIMSDTWDGHVGATAKEIKKDTAALNMVDAWVLHRIGANSNILIKDSTLYSSNTDGKPVFTNEFEYFDYTRDKEITDDNFINTAQTIMNWMTFADSPTWFWLHALKPTYNEEAQSFALGIWRPENDSNFSHFKNIKKGHWDYVPRNFNAIAGFLKYMPWDSKRYGVDESTIKGDNRIMAYKTPKGKLVIALTNRSGKDFQYRINTSVQKKFKGYRYTSAERNAYIGKKAGSSIDPIVPNYAIEFWVEQ